MPSLSKAKCAAKQRASDKEIPEEMPNELEGSGGNGEEGMLNELESGDENNSEGGGEEEILNIFDDNGGNLWGDEEDSGWESESDIEIE
ncbi:15210_t:CDS:2 [Funneliformis geosporum]|uniref:7642_t:CDS:1 n=1 Tax=Funneliformis geosporum TaxID=1117311 RepID=A0A9W4WXA1_9GLOM|nr:15210_t:CDS:2 [Funneliformis geosporum]CAI2170408.1 7642_t:CDS:2 [Funneliformis geosporum]